MAHRPPAPPRAPERPAGAPVERVRLEVMSVPIDIRLVGTASEHRQTVLGAWSRCLPAAQTRAEAPSAPVELIYTSEDAADAPGMFSDLTSRVTLEAIAALRGRDLLFHAAGLADPTTGHTGVLVAPSGTGKTTAARILGAELGYVSDETVRVNPHTLAVTAYPKPLSVIVTADAPKEQLSPDVLGLRTAPADLRLTHLFILDRAPTVATPSISAPLPLTEALKVLAPNISALASVPRPLSTLLEMIERVGGVRAVRYREFDDVAAAVRDAIRTRPDAHPKDPANPGSDTAGPEHVPPGPSDVAGGRDESRTARPHEHGAEPRVTVAPWVEAVANPEDESQLVVLLPERLVVLGGIGPAVWHACRIHGALDMEALVEHVSREYGPHPHAHEIVAEAVTNLLAEAALTRAR